MSIHEIKINKWNGGMPDCEDERNLGNGYLSYLEGFTAGENETVLQQVADVSVSDGSYVQSSTTYYHKIIATLDYSGDIYGLGADSAGKFCLWKYSSNTWTAITITNAENFALIANPFFIYCNGEIYFQNGTRYLGHYTIASGSNDGHWVDNTSLILHGGVEFQGSLYGWDSTGNIYKQSVGGGASTSINSVSVDQSVVEMIPYGNLLAIICTSSVNTSKMYLWDGATTTTFYDIVDIGIGNVAGGTLIDGVIRVVITGLSNTDMRIRQYSSGVFVTEEYYVGRSNNYGTVNLWPQSRVKKCRGFIYWIMAGTRPNSIDATEAILFRYGNKVSGTHKSICAYKNLEFSISQTNTPDKNVGDFIILDDKLHQTDKYFSIFAVVPYTSIMEEIMTIEDYYTQTSALETGYYDGGNMNIDKKLLAVDLQFRGLTGTGVICYYKKDAETSWTQIFSDNTANDLHYTARNITGGENLPTFKQIDFRIEAKGGQTLTGFKFKYEQQTSIYGD